MIKQVLLIAAIAVLLFSCDDYQASPVEARWIASLNQQIFDAHKSGETWTLSPEEIARQIFPPVSNGRPTLYEIYNKMEALTKCQVTITEEGPMDDEVFGERRIIDFTKIEGIWRIDDLKYASKRRF